MLKRLRHRAAPASSADTEARHRRSMAARPVQAPRLIAKERPDGGLQVTVSLRRPRWQRLLAGEGTMERTFGLDSAGRQVYEWCDGRATVEDLVHRFAREKKAHFAEAQTAVTIFLRTLATKGLVVMEMDKRKT